MNYTPNANAPDMLLDVIAEVGSVLAKTKPSDSSKFWDRVLGVMKYAYGYMDDLAWVIRKNEMLSAENEFLKHWSRELQDRLNRYETIESEKLNGTFEETVKKVTEYLERRS